jgi:hypothetical protein
MRKRTPPENEPKERRLISKKARQLDEEASIEIE